MSAQPSIQLQDACNLLVVSAHRDWNEVEHLLTAWSDLVSQSSTLSIFVTPEWQYSWWRAYGAGKQLCILEFSDSQVGVVGIAPLYWDRVKSPFLREFRTLQFVGDGSSDSDDLDFIVKPGYAGAVTDAFLRWMGSVPWDICELHCVPSKSEVAALLAGRLHAMGWKNSTLHRPRARVILPNTWEQYLKQLSSKERGKVGYRLRRLEARHRVSFRCCEHSEQLPLFLDNLYLLHQKRWEARGEPGTFHLPERRRFYLEMTRLLLDRKWLALWQMDIDDTPVASQIGMRFGNYFYALQEGFDPDHATDSVGYVLRSYVLRKCIETGVRTYDFLYGDQEAKQRWGADVDHYLDIRFAKSNSLAAAYLTSDEALRASKDWVRAHASEKTVETLKALWRSLKRSEPKPTQSVA